VKIVDEGPVFAEEEEVHLINYVNVLLKRRWLIVLGVFFCVVITGIYSKRQPSVYTASAKFLPSRNPEMTSRMGTLIGTSGRIESFQNNVTSEYYTVLLKSSPFLERIAYKKFFSKELGEEVDLISYYQIEADNETERLIKATRVIGGGLELSTARTTKVVSLSYSSGEPELSAAIVNAFLEELITYNQEVRDSKAKQNRIFIEERLEENRKLLKKAEAELADFTTKNKKIVTPDLVIELDRLKRNVKVQEEVYVMLKKQLELAKIEEQEKKPVIEIIEKASVPLYKSSPKTKRSVILAGFVSVFLFICLAFVLEYISKMNPKDEGYKEFFKHLTDIKNDLLIVTKIIGKRKKGS
jgi:uncharacterized protein involved in exopolysaccharide biosynthesis